MHAAVRELNVNVGYKRGVSGNEKMAVPIIQILHSIRKEKLVHDVILLATLFVLISHNWRTQTKVFSDRWSKLQIRSLQS